MLSCRAPPSLVPKKVIIFSLRTNCRVRAEAFFLYNECSGDLILSPNYFKNR